ncbi:MAG TPA: protein kinase, partial [Planctomicrobium sp.]|nr:protein kinase [Planctomicrobium sp.]
MTTSQSQSAVNSRWIWPFEILEQIGEGGMGVVYRARYVVNGRQVALKMMPAEVADKTAMARFERELEVLKTLRHPNIVRCFGGVCEDKRHFYAMELLEGGSLEDQLRKRGKFAWEQVIQYGLQMCEALKCSHEKGVIHRDVKPSNFLLTPSGQLKLSDFGLASVSASHKITAAGKTAGTFLYMAPEQIRGHEVTPRTDLYALGCVLFELTTNDVPFLGETAAATLQLHCFTAPPRPTEKALDCPIALERIILKLLQKDPAERYQSAEAVARELQAVQQTVTITTPLEKGKNFPTGYKPDERPQLLTEKKTRELPKLNFSGQEKRWVLALSGALALSLLLNAVQWNRNTVAARWEDSWKQALENPDHAVRVTALRTVGKMVQHDRGQLQTLLKSLEHPQPDVRAVAASSLGEAGYAAL